MKIGVERLLEIAGVAVNDLEGYAGRDRATIYRHINDDPPPLWMLEAVGKWYDANKPLKPECIDIAFRTLLHDLWPKPPVNPGSNRGGKKPRPGLGFSSPVKNTPSPEVSARMARAEARLGFDPTRTQEAAHALHYASVVETAAIGGGHHASAHGGGNGHRMLPAPTAIGPAACAAAVEPREDSRRGLGTVESRATLASAEAARATPPACVVDAEAPSQARGGLGGFNSPGEVNPSRGLARGGARGAGYAPAHAPALSRWTHDDLTDIHRAVKIWRDFSGMRPLPRRLMDQFCDAILDQHPAWLKTATRGALAARLRRASGACLRNRQADPDLDARKEALATYTLSFAAKIEKQAHSKGAYQRRSWLSFRPVLEGLLDVEAWRERAETILGREVNLAMLERIFRSRFGGLSPVERGADEYLQRTVGFRPEWCGQVVQIDGSEIPVEVLNGWGRARRDGDLAQIFLACTDMGSLRTLIYRQADTSEVHLWDPALQEWMFGLGFAPEMVIADEVGRSFNALRYAKEGEAPNLSLGVRLWLAAGVRPYCHKPGNPRGKAAVESGGVKSFKNTAKRFLCARWAAKELAGMARYYKGAADYRTLDSENEWCEILAACEGALNARLLQRMGMPRQAAWDADPLGVEKRAERALAADARETYRGICARAHVWTVAGNSKLLARHNGRRAYADLVTPLPDAANDRTAIMFPCGLLKRDEQYDGELWRGVVVQDRAGQPVYHAVEALCAKQSFLGFDLNKPTIHEHAVNVPELRHERRKRAWDRAAVLKEGTTGQPVAPAVEDSVLKDE